MNPLPYRRVRLVEHRGGAAVVELGGFEGRAVELPPVAPPTPAGGTTIANGVLEVVAAADGTLSVTDLRDGRRFSGLHLVEDEPDLGDLYTFCPGGPARRADLVGVRVLRNGPLVSELLVETALPGVGVRTVIRLVDGIDRVELRTTVENTAADHRLRVLFPVEAGGDEARAEAQFEVAHRPLEPPPPAAPWVEPPVPTAHTLGTVAVGPLALMTKGLPGVRGVPRRDASHAAALCRHDLTAVGTADPSDVGRA